MTAPRKLRQTAALALALTACIVSIEASAAYSCSITVTAISTVYSPTVATPNDSTGSYTLSCTRAAGDSSNMTYTLRADNGIHSAGNQNRVQFGAAANRYNYELYRNAGYTQVWGNTGATDINGTLVFGASLSATFTGPFYLRVPGSQPVDPAGSYTDTVTVTLNPQGGGNTVTAPMSVTVITTNSCQISVPPGNVDFTYTSFQVAASAAGTLYGVRCTTALPYTMALDATSGTLLGLSYMLSLSSSSSTGTGFTQTYTIDGSIAGGQAGTCATAVCTGSQTRTLTVTY